MAIAFDADRDTVSDSRQSSLDVDCLRKVYESFHDDYPVLRDWMSLDRLTRTCVLLDRFYKTNATVVDVGAWPGVVAGCLARLGFRVTAVDKEPGRPYEWNQAALLDVAGAGKCQAVDSVAALCEREGVNVVKADIERESLPIGDDSADIVLLTEVIEHLWHDPIFVLCEINRILKNNTGIMVLSTPNLTCLRHRVNFLRGRISRVIEHPFVSFLKARRLGHLGHCRLYAPGELTSMLTLLGFECTISFTQYAWRQHDAAAGAKGSSASAPQANQGGKSGFGKLFRSPQSYWSAACATALDISERLVPTFRPQIFIVARKVADADFDRNFPEETRRLVMSNSLTAN